MYKIGLKLWSTNTDHYLREAKRLYVDKVFDYIELFVVPDTLGKLEAWTRLHQEDGIPFVMHNAHSAVGFNLADADCEKRNREIYLQTKQFADRLDVEHIIFHCGVDGTIEEAARQLKNFEEPRALIENKPYLPLSGPQNRKVCRGATHEELLYALTFVGCGFCLDVGHAVCAANALGIEPYAYVDQLNALNPAIFHLSDISDMTSPYDAHPHLGTGSLDIARLCKRVFDAAAMISIETVKDSMFDLNDFITDVQFLQAACPFCKSVHASQS